MVSEICRFPFLYPTEKAIRRGIKWRLRWFFVIRFWRWRRRWWRWFFWWFRLGFIRFVLILLLFLLIFFIQRGWERRWKAEKEEEKEKVNGWRHLMVADCDGMGIGLITSHTFDTSHIAHTAANMNWYPKIGPRIVLWNDQLFDLLPRSTWISAMYLMEIRLICAEISIICIVHMLFVFVVKICFCWRFFFAVNIYSPQLTDQHFTLRFISFLRRIFSTLPHSP